MGNIYDAKFLMDNKSWRLVKEYEVKKLLEHSIKNKNVLEIGLGDGYITELLSNFFKEVIAVDISQEVINSVRKRLIKKKNIIFINSSIEKLNLDFKIHNFYLGHILEHMDFPVESLTNFKKMFSSESIGYISVPNSNSIHRQIGVIMGLLESTDALNEKDISFGHKRLYTIRKLKDQVKKAGFKIIKSGGCFLKTMTYKQIDEFYSEELIRGFIKIADKYPEISGDIYVIVKKFE